MLSHGSSACQLPSHRSPTRTEATRTRVFDSRFRPLRRFRRAGLGRGVGTGWNGSIMTKNKARKSAIRERSARTGERYVVARRAIESQSGARLEGVLHRLTHRIPGVPEHVNGGLRSRANRPHRPAVQFTRRHGEPRVLVGLQRRIARLLRAE